jgi:putative tricarboxylic transport membrane protein
VNDISQAFILSFTPLSLIVAFVSTLIGVILGAIPGLNGGIGIAVMMPFTYGMSPTLGLLFLGGIYMGSSYGGAITAILINCPGTSNATCTAIEGYPLAKQGRGKEALYYAAYASSWGGLLGVLALIFFTPALARLSLKFGPPEMLLVSISGLAIVGSMSAGKARRGIFSAICGLSLKMIGMQASTGMPRLTWGTKTLLSGIDTLPAIIGLFALAEMVHQAVILIDGDNEVEKMELEKGKIALPTLIKTFSLKAGHGITLWKSSLIGTIVGILPGTGGAIAAFIAYGDAKRVSKHPERFGNGAEDGIVAVESANNAAVGGSMVPMLGLGIPGSTNSAIMLGAMTVHGLIPGYQLFHETPRIAYGFLFGMLLTVVFMLLIGVAGVPLFSLILKVKMEVVVPIVIACCLLGAYSSRNSLTDVFFACVFGVIGVVFNKFDIPCAPMLLGLILGGLIENYFVKTVMLANAAGQSIVRYVVTRPMCIVIAALCAYLIYSNSKDAVKTAKIKSEIKKEQQAH